MITENNDAIISNGLLAFQQFGTGETFQHFRPIVFGNLQYLVQLTINKLRKQ